MKVTEVETIYKYCKGLIDGIECYIEPMAIRSSDISQQFRPLKKGEYYLMSLVYSNPQLQWYNYISSLDIYFKTAKGKRILVEEAMKMVPDSFIAVNMIGCSIRPIIPDDLEERTEWPQFIFHPAIPSISWFGEGKANPNDLQYGVNVLSRIPYRPVAAYFAKFRPKYEELKSKCPPANLPVKNRSDSLPKLRRP